jgi:hypothetical protein
MRHGHLSNLTGDRNNNPSCMSCLIRPGPKLWSSQHGEICSLCCVQVVPFFQWTTTMMQAALLIRTLTVRMLLVFARRASHCCLLHELVSSVGLARGCGVCCLPCVQSPMHLLLLSVPAATGWGHPNKQDGCCGRADPRLTDYDTLLQNIQDLKDGKQAQVSALCLWALPHLPHHLLSCHKIRLALWFCQAGIGRLATCSEISAGPVVGCSCRCRIVIFAVWGWLVSLYLRGNYPKQELMCWLRPVLGRAVVSIFFCSDIF